LLRERRGEKRSGEERRGEGSAGNFKLAVHRVLYIEVIELSMRYR
jgi:hypothetical protein